MAQYSLLTVPFNQESIDRIAECQEYMPYTNRITSCTETSARVLGYITEGTFQQCAQLHAVQPHLVMGNKIEESLTRANNTPVSFQSVNIEVAYGSLTPNSAAMMCSSRSTGGGHTMIISRNGEGEAILVDPSVGVTHVGEASIREYLHSENLTVHSVPVVPTGTPITITPFGGGFKFIMVNIPKTEDMYAMLGMVADKTFSRLVNKSAPLILVSIDIESTLKNMANKATLIYGEKHKGHTMILLKKSRLELMDPVTNLKYVGYSEIMKYLSTFKKIITLYTKSMTKSRSRTKSRTFKSK